MADRKDQRRGLGRGLSALMADVEPRVTEGDSAGAQPDRRIPIENIAPNPDQPRRHFSKDQLEELSNSIRAKGVLQPLIVRLDPKNEGQYQIVAGERRWRAAQIAQVHELPVIVRDFDDTEVLEVAIIENIQRADLNAIEEAAGYRQLMDKFGHTQEKLAEALGKSRSHIANLLRLLNLPPSVQDMVSEGVLSAGHARTMVTADDPEGLAKAVVQRGLSVREAEKLAKGDTPSGKQKNPASKSQTSTKDADTKALEGDLSAALGMKVTIDHAAGKESGRISINYDSLEDLDLLCGVLSSAK
ncbi:ParB/RepB/Spo0J family partition protein [Thalassococcus lentus]|uniref:ParB/RepB/Spo0J family partition protein n=1 Tax=Thalassococcus lentus TaxID=1210524 RepID=A0ABT4XN88_9RHOB|nr:ParB/RepB/Spo0J family partition protein [Thalassococcus lentus]MDA7423406.1 ParB/RepB/Spo0J family partition protein [Thalassococcus lentus]